MQLRLLGKQNIYMEIAEQYKRYINFGVFKLDDKLPSCRALAIELGINPNTVERAYSQLEAEGYIKTLPKKGVYVCYNKNALDGILTDAEKQINYFKTAGISKKQLEDIILKVYETQSPKIEKATKTSKEAENID